MPRVPIHFAKYGSTRVDADAQRTVNMFPHQGRGYRQFPGLSVNSFVSSFVENQNRDISAEDTAPLAIVFNNDGSKMFVTGNSNGKFFEYALSTEWDISTESLTTSIAQQESGERLSAFSDDGLKMYTDDQSSGNLREYTLSVAYDLTSTVQVNHTETNLTSDLSGTSFNDDGTVMIVLSTVNFAAALKSFSLSTGFDLSTINTTPTDTLDVSDEIGTNGGGLAFSDSGKTMSILDPDDGVITTWALATGYDISTASKVGELDASNTDSSPEGLFIGKSGSKLYFCGDTNNNVYEFDITFTYGERGGVVMDGVPYVVMGTQLVSVSSSGGATSLHGTITGTQRCVLDTDGTRLVIANGSNPYQFTVSGGLTEITDSDLGSPDTTAYLDRRFAFDEDQQFVVSALDDPTTIDSLDFATAESMDDDLVRVFTLNQLMYMFGTRTIEIWYTSGVGRPPLDRQAVIDEMGIIGRYAVAGSDNTIYFVDEQRRLNRMVGQQFEHIWIPALGEEWQSYSTVSDCIVNAYTIDQENIIEVHFPTANATWAYHENSGEMVEREDSSNDRARITTYLEAFGKLLGVDHSNGKVYEFDNDTYQDDGNAITRIVDTAIVTSELFEVPGREMIAHGVRATFQSSGAATVNVSFSSDLSTFGTERSITLSSGINQKELRRWGKFTEGIWRFKTTSNAKVDLIDVSADLEMLRD